jgi:hypothetical protein
MQRFSFLLCLLIILAIAGCGKSGVDKDMGTIYNRLPKVEGADKPYDMPQLKEESTDNQETKEPTTDK